MSNQVDPDWDLPGSGLNFQDVTNLFVEAAEEMPTDHFMFMEGYTLHDAMSALEIGEPRLDSGVVVPEQITGPFEPLQLLLPEEICWILDRSLAFETEFHAGNFLVHTVHTLVYIHNMFFLDPEVASSSFTGTHDPSRPLELLTLVLRGAILGMLKCCDLAWRELAKGGAYDTEDWQSDKTDVSLCESTPTPVILATLSNAIRWASTSGSLDPYWRTALEARLSFRKTLVELFSTDLNKDIQQYQRYLQEARIHLQVMEAFPSKPCSASSPAHRAFDPYIGRQLNMSTPIRVIEPPDLSQTIKFLQGFLENLDETSQLAPVSDLTTWEMVAFHRLWNPNRVVAAPYTRSIAQTTFYDGLVILGKHSFGWMINRFFLETIGEDYDAIHSTVARLWNRVGPNPLKKVEKMLFRLITPHIRGLWHNPPRMRRHFMKALLEWHRLYDALLETVEGLKLEDMPRGHLIHQLPNVALVWRLSLVREVVLSGFQLELYSMEEKSLSYWYAARVIDTHLGRLENLIPAVRKGSRAQKEMLYQTQFLAALQALCSAMYMVTVPLLSFDWDKMRPNFFRRYKWAFRTDYDNSENDVIGQPELHVFIRQATNAVVAGDLVPAEPVNLARSILNGIIESYDAGGCLQPWDKVRMPVIHNLLAVCDNLAGLPDTAEAMNTFDPIILKWDPSVHPWFPSLPVTSNCIMENGSN
ncbi:Mak10 subunit, NatC N-terminal acetyltransferase-domain-containing protein [Panaeolus papilionaceus]|nr:Mak10 subunit, NatC N-terminal acetyltransferase-domain-containing protein [Panaeolus papilionaceus]